MPSRKHVRIGPRPRAVPRKDPSPVAYPSDAIRPTNRTECADGPRPCPWVSCRYHLQLDVAGPKGILKDNFPGFVPSETCALDVADRGGITLDEASGHLNLTRERIRQIEDKALAKLRRGIGQAGIARDVDEWLGEMACRPTIEDNLPEPLLNRDGPLLLSRIRDWERRGGLGTASVILKALQGGEATVAALKRQIRGEHQHAVIRSTLRELERTGKVVAKVIRTGKRARKIYSVVVTNATSN
jgi:hypothetical protein